MKWLSKRHIKIGFQVHTPNPCVSIDLVHPEYTRGPLMVRLKSALRQGHRTRLCDNSVQRKVMSES